MLAANSLNSLQQKEKAMSGDKREKTKQRRNGERRETKTETKQSDIEVCLRHYASDEDKKENKPPSCFFGYQEVVPRLNGGKEKKGHMKENVERGKASGKPGATWFRGERQGSGCEKINALRNRRWW